MTVNTTTGEIVEPMSEHDLDALAECEAEIAEGVALVGEALAAIRADRLYRGTHATFDAYCSERWGISRSTAHRRIAAAEVVQILSPIGDSPNPPSIPESQARELAPLRNEPEVVRSIFADVQRQSAGKPTAAMVRAAVKRHLSPVPPPPPQDEKFWNDAAEKATASGWVAKRDAERPYSMAISRLVRVSADITGIALHPADIATNVPAHDLGCLADIEAAAAWLTTFVNARKESA